MLPSAVKQLRRSLEELCKEWTGHVASFIHPTEAELESDGDTNVLPATFIVVDNGSTYHIKWSYVGVKFILTYSPKLHLLILGEHRVSLSLLAVMDGLYIDGLIKADLLSFNTPIVVSVPLNIPISKIEDWRGGNTFLVEGHPIEYSINNVGHLSRDKSRSTIDFKTLIR